jgi:hypothetical protein
MTEIVDTDWPEIEPASCRLARQGFSENHLRDWGRYWRNRVGIHPENPQSQLKML